MNGSGLTSAQAESALKRYGLNEIEEKKQSLIRKILKRLASPIYFMFLAALVLTLVANRIFDFYLILILAVLNFFIGFWQERKADNAIEDLKKQLVVKTKVLRDGRWEFLESKFVVPGDFIEAGVGDLVPADTKIIEATNASLNEASLTGESLPKSKKAGDTAYAGSFLSTGVIRGEVAATGGKTEFGKTISIIDTSLKRSILEKDIISISRMISFLSIAVVVIFSVTFIVKQAPLSELFLVDLSLLIAGIPISLPTVMAVIIALGVAELAKKGAIVRRLSSLEDFANVNLLLTDKTGTLTKNELSVQKIVPYGSYSTNDVIEFASYAVAENSRSEIDKVILRAAADADVERNGKVTTLIPADSERKRSSATVEKGKSAFTVSLGAPQIIEALCAWKPADKKKFEDDIASFARNGYRTLAVALNSKSAGEKGMKIIGIVAFADTLREESKEIIDFLKANGVDVKMVTGDNILISRKIAGDVGLDGNVTGGADLKGLDWEKLDRQWLESRVVFSEVLPADKYRLVELAKRFHVVAVTGDGVNDLPALKISDVGIAVSNAVDALKSAADITLLKSGLSIIKEALIEARKIFARLYVYSVYRISESFRLIITIGILGLLYGYYPLTAVQIILLALLNDIPIISLAFNRVKTPGKPAVIHPKKRLLLGSLFALSGIANSLILFFILVHWTNLDMASIQTIYFLKLTVSGHMLIYVAHTKQRWFRFLPSRTVILTTTITQLVSSLMAGFGLFMAPISISMILFVWGWSFLWMQVSELVKYIPEKIEKALL